MTTSIKNRRKQRRHSVARTIDAWVEFDHPLREIRCRCRLSDLSAAGLSFVADVEGGGFEAGANLTAAVVDFGQCRIGGELVVLHVSRREPHGNEVCGALFYPASDDDLRALKGVLAGIEAVRAD